MFTAIILICLATVPKAACNADTAEVVAIVPGQMHSDAACGLHAQTFAAMSPMLRLRDGEYLKVFCRSG